MSMAQMFGYIEPAQARALEERVEEAERELVTLRAAVINLENLSDAFSALGFGSGGPVPVTVVSGSAEGAPSVSDGSVKSEGSDDSAADESSVKSGSNDSGKSASGNKSASLSL